MPLARRSWCELDHNAYRRSGRGKMIAGGPVTAPALFRARDRNSCWCLAAGRYRVVLSELAIWSGAVIVAWMIYGYFRRSAIGGVSGIVRNRRDHILAVQVLLGNGRAGEDVRYAAASASACFYLVFDCGCAVLCRGVYSPAPVMNKGARCRHSRDQVGHLQAGSQGRYRWARSRPLTKPLRSLRAPRNSWPGTWLMAIRRS